MQDSLKEELEKLGIYQLRIYARHVGVKLPTTIKKAELIDSILAILNGQSEPYVKSTKKGRPAKELVDYTNQVDTYNPIFGSVLSSPPDYGFKGLLSGEFVYDKEDESKRCNVCGILDIFSNGSGVLVPIDGSQNYTYVNQDIIVNRMLVRGDKVSGTAFEVSEDKICMLADIETVNGFDIFSIPNKVKKVEKKPKDTLFDFNESKNKLSNIFDCVDIPIKMGDNILVAGTDRKVLPFAVFNLLEVMASNKNLKVVVLATNVSEDYMYAVSKYENVEVIGASFGLDAEMQLKVFDLGMQYVRNISYYEGVNVVCIVPSISGILNCCDDQSLSKWQSYLKQLYMIAGNTNGASITMVYGMEIDSENALYQEFEAGSNVYLESCSIAEVRQLYMKLNWLSCYRNDLVDISVAEENSYSYSLSHFLNLDKNYIQQQKIEHWVNSGLSKDKIKTKIDEYLN